MDQMTGGMDQGAGTGAAAGGFGQQDAGAQGGAGQQAGGAAGATSGQGQQPYTLSPKWQGKSVEDVARAYDELEKKFGSQGNQYGEMRKQLEQWQRFGTAFDPILRQFNYDPQALAQQLQARAQAAAQRGDIQGAQQLQAQARKAWADVMYETPDKQEQWLRSEMQGAVGPVQQQMQQGFQQIVQQGTEYINRYMDLAIRALQAKIENPSLSVEALLQQAVGIASGQYDPLEWSKRILTAETPDAARERIVKEERAKWEQEQRNRAMTTFPGGAAAAPRTLRPSTTVGTPAAKPARPTEGGMMANAKERFLNKMGSWAPDGR